jgi:hypothetical protein
MLIGTIQINKVEFPTLFGIALNYLPIQASSVPCERVFLSAKETDTLKRNRIHPVLMEALQTLKFLLKKERFNFTGGWQTAPSMMKRGNAGTTKDLLAHLLTGIARPPPMLYCIRYQMATMKMMMATMMAMMASLRMGYTMTMWKTMTLTKNKLVVFIRSLLLMLFVIVHIPWFTHVACACAIIQPTKSIQIALVLLALP